MKKILAAIGDYIKKHGQAPASFLYDGLLYGGFYC